MILSANCPHDAVLARFTLARVKHQRAETGGINPRTCRSSLLRVIILPTALIAVKETTSLGRTSMLALDAISTAPSIPISTPGVPKYAMRGV